MSHWGAYALIAALSVALDRPALLDCLDPALDRTVLEALVRDGPAVDGVTLRRDLTIDGLDLQAHGAVLARVRELAR